MPNQLQADSKPPVWSPVVVTAADHPRYQQAGTIRDVPAIEKTASQVVVQFDVDGAQEATDLRALAQLP
jgi:hypothetical protein